MNSSHFTVAGLGAVSPAGWDVSALRRAVLEDQSLPIRDGRREGSRIATRTRPVPRPAARLPFLRHARLRRCSSITRFCVAAALQTLDQARRDAIRDGRYRLGILFVFMNGCVNYSNRFFGEVLADPGLASPILFPETVFNAPASHLAAMLGSTGPSTTLIGDSAHYLAGLEQAMEWLLDDRVDGALVVGGEELDWLSSETATLFSRRAITSEGAGALLLEKPADPDEKPLLTALTPAFTYSLRQPRTTAVETAWQTLCAGEVEGETVKDPPTVIHGREHQPDHHRYSPDQVLGDGLGAALALQCVFAVSLLSQADHETVRVFHEGTNLQAIGARFDRAPTSSGH